MEKNPYFEVIVNDIKVVMTNDPWLDIDTEKELKDAIPINGGRFKLESKIPMDPLLVLLIYRHRVDIELPISSVKSVINLHRYVSWEKVPPEGSWCWH